MLPERAEEHNTLDPRRLWQIDDRTGTASQLTHAIGQVTGPALDLAHLWRVVARRFRNLTGSPGRLDAAT